MPPDPIQAARNLFIRRWGEMGASWGISRTMAELHALLYLAPEPLCTDDIMDQLSVSRGSASTNLRELVNWGLVQRVHRRGDRKEYFEAEKDVWQMFETIVRERRRREVQPIVETIERCTEMVNEGRRMGRVREEGLEEHMKRYSDILEFCEVINSLINLLGRMGRSGLVAVAEEVRKAEIAVANAPLGQTKAKR